MVYQIDAGAVVLRAYVDADAPDVLLALADPAIATWNPAVDAGDDLGSALVWMARRNDWSVDDHRSWAVGHDGRLAGAVSLHHLDLDQRNAELGYWVAPWARRRGVAVAASAAATSYAFATLGLVRVFLYHSVENDPSCGVATGAGFALEGTLRQSYRYGDGRHHDEHLHARLATD